MGAEGGTSLLETPPYVIAVVFLFFLVVTLGFEWVRARSARIHPTMLLDALCDKSETAHMS